MDFNGKWLTTEEFATLKTIDVYHKERNRVELEKTPAHLMNNHTKFRKVFEAQQGKKYTINISADDYYKLYVNGKFVCQGPASSRFDKFYYNRADITPYIVSGKNVIAVHVYYQGYINRVWDSGDNRQGLIADVFADDVFAFGTDKSWVYTYSKEFVDGGTTGYDTQFLENIDFNLAEPDWNKADYDDSAYLPAVEHIADDHKFMDCAPVVDVYNLKPQLVKELAPGHLFVDMGKEYTGQLHFIAKGSKGEKVIIRCGEETVEGNPFEVRYDMRCNCHYEDVCTLSGGEDEFLFFDYKTFRYAEIISESDCVDIDTLDMIVRHHKFDSNGYSFSSNNELLEKIWEICAQALKIGVQEGYLDCPSREKGQYLGDFGVSGFAHLYLTGDWQMYRKALIDFATSCEICEGMMAVSPGSLMQEIADFSLIYPLIVTNYLNYTGDEATARDLIPIMEGILSHFSKFRRADGLLEGAVEKWNLVDWPSNLRDNYDFELAHPQKFEGCHNVVNAYYYCALKTVEDLKQTLGIEYTVESDKVAKAYVNAFYKPQMGLFTDTEESTHASLHSNVLPACFGIAPEEAKENIKNHIMQKGLCCGVWFSYFVLKALAKMGAYEEEYQLIVNRTEHSWYNMISEGATTCYEAWGKEQKINTSLCHPWASSPIIALIEDIAGICPSSFYTGELKAESHMPEGLSLNIKLPAKGGAIEFCKNN